jgi:hypothetical protein
MLHCQNSSAKELIVSNESAASGLIISTASHSSRGTIDVFDDEQQQERTLLELMQASPMWLDLISQHTQQAATVGSTGDGTSADASSEPTAATATATATATGTTGTGTSSTKTSSSLRHTTDPLAAPKVSIDPAMTPAVDMTAVIALKLEEGADESEEEEEPLAGYAECIESASLVVQKLAHQVSRVQV